MTSVDNVDRFLPEEITDVMTLGVYGTVEYNSLVEPMIWCSVQS